MKGALGLKGNGDMFKGSFTALITPFKNGSIDEDALRRFVDWQISEGTHGLVPDRAAALSWYCRAAAMGVAEAQALIVALEAMP